MAAHEDALSMLEILERMKAVVSEAVKPVSDDVKELRQELRNLDTRFLPREMANQMLADRDNKIDMLRTEVGDMRRDMHRDFDKWDEKETNKESHNLTRYSLSWQTVGGTLGVLTFVFYMLQHVRYF